eukprot:GEZU01029615.1.p1 GENE.GEZU01029615.1~~GEZU01029615.1.p1  ORF type:complete len:260 (-),score=56.86 GEZU01029615.1:386-1165(-)
MVSMYQGNHLKSMATPYGTRLFRWCGLFLREAGQAMDRLGNWMQGDLGHLEQLNRHRRVMKYMGKIPVIGNGVFIAPSAHVIGSVTLGNGSSVWYNSVLRGDVQDIKVGERSNLQDRTIVHVSGNFKETPTIIGDLVTVETGAILHACTLESESYVGIGATILDEAVVSSQSMVAPGSVVPPGVKIPSGELWAGTPAKFLRKLTTEERQSIAKMAEDIYALAEKHQSEHAKEFEELQREIENFKARDQRLGDYNYTSRS